MLLRAQPREKWCPSLILYAGTETWPGFVLVYHAIWCIPLGMKWMAGVWACELTPHPVVMCALDQFFSQM